jgi:hypothetical protein
MKARFQTMPLAVKIGIAILILIALWVLIQWVGQNTTEEAEAQIIATTLGMY